MALAARQTQVAVGKDHVIGVERRVVVDPESGIAAEVENVTVAVDLGDGNIGVARQQKVTGIRTAGYVPPQSRPGITAAPVQQQPRAPTYSPTTTSEPSSSNSDAIHLIHCIICIICPCWIVVWILYCCLED